MSKTIPVTTGGTRTDAAEHRGPSIQLLSAGCLAREAIHGKAFTWPENAERCELALSASVLGRFTLEVIHAPQPWRPALAPVQVAGGTVERRMVERQLVPEGAFLRVSFEAMQSASRVEAWLTPLLGG